MRLVWAVTVGYPVGWSLTGILIGIGVVASLFNAYRFIRKGEAFWGRLVFLFVGRLLRVRGMRNRSPGKQYLVLANHSSLFDIPVVLAAVPDVAFVGREVLMRIPVFRSLLRIIGYIPIETSRIRRSHDAIQEAIRKAGRGMSILMFPEGTRTLTGDVQALKRGFIYVLRQSGLDVLPVTIRGTFALKPKKRKLLDPRDPIEAIIHRPIPNAWLAPRPDGEIVDIVQRALKNEGGASYVHA